MKQNRRGEEKKEREKKWCISRAERTIQVIVEARQHQWKQGNIKMTVSEDHASCWVHKDLAAKKWHAPRRGYIFAIFAGFFQATRLSLMM